MSSSDELINSDAWRLVDITVPSHETELVSDFLWGQGVVAIEEINKGIIVILRTSMGENPHAAVASIRETFPYVSVTTVDVDRSVADTWREFAEPTHVVDDVFLVPAWLEAPAGSRSLFIEPLDTFGLGNHPTTVLALRLAIQNVAFNSTVFDFGSGSGVLAVGVASLLSCTAFAYDIADSAQDALRMNATRNKVNTCQWINGFPNAQVDAVLANILAPVLIAEANNICSAVGVGGVIVLSGMRDDQVDKVLLHYSTCKEIERDELDGWVAVALQKTN